jgi:uncharacterized membrane protein
LSSGRLEAFSDAVIAIVITIMVLELTVPSVHETAGGDKFQALWGLRFIFLSYVLSFAYLAIFWNNHHHMMFVTERVDGVVLWTNMHLLFWLSLIPFTTAWMGENEFAAAPTALYGGVLLMCALAYFILQRGIVHAQGKDSLLANAVGRDLRGKTSPVLYAAAIPLAFWQPWLSYVVYVAITLMWIVPDLRIERAVEKLEDANGGDDRRNAEVGAVKEAEAEQEAAEDAGAK